MAGKWEQGCSNWFDDERQDEKQRVKGVIWVSGKRLAKVERQENGDKDADGSQ